MAGEPRNYYCKPDAPDDIRNAILTVDFPGWCREQTVERLEAAMTEIQPMHGIYLGVVEREIERRRHKEIHDKLTEISKPHWALKWTFWAALAAAIIGILSWFFPDPLGGVKTENHVVVGQHPTTSPEATTRPLASSSASTPSPRTPVPGVSPTPQPK